MALLTLTRLLESNGLAIAAAAASAGGDTAPNPDGKVFLYVKNAGAGGITVTVTPAKPTLAIPGQGQFTKATPAVAVAAGAEALLGPFPPAIFNDGNGNLDITYSGVTSVEVAAFQLPVY